MSQWAECSCDVSSLSLSLSVALECGLTSARSGPFKLLLWPRLVPSRFRPLEWRLSAAFSTLRPFNGRANEAKDCSPFRPLTRPQQPHDESSNKTRDCIGLDWIGLDRIVLYCIVFYYALLWRLVKLDTHLASSLCIRL